MQERYGALAPAGARLPSLGILSLAGSLRAAGHQAALADPPAQAIYSAETASRAAAFAPDAVGISAVTATMGRAARLARALRHRLPGVFIVLGGPHASALPEDTLAAIPEADCVVVGEGERTMVELAGALDAGRPLSQVPGLALRKNGGVHRTAPRAPIEDLDSLPPPAWDLLEGFPDKFRPAAFKHRRLPAAHIVTGRGCPHKCVFCDRTVFGNRIRLHSADYVLSLVRDLAGAFGVREVAFEDDRFLADPDRAADICEKLIRAGRPVAWTALARADQMQDPALLRLMREAGCWQVGMGVESGDPEVLAGTKKGVTLEQVRRAASLAREAGLSIKGYFILGLPGETMESLARTIRFAANLPLSDASAFFLTPFPGTRIYAHAEKWGTMNRDFSRMNELYPVFIPHGLTERDLVNAARRFAARFYLRPRVVGGYAARVAGNPRLLPAVASSFFGLARHVAGRGPGK